MKAIANDQAGHVERVYAGTRRHPLGGVVVRFADGRRERFPFGSTRLIVEPTDAQLETVGTIPLTAAARRLGVQTATLRRQIALGRLAATKIGRDWHVQTSEVDRYHVESRRS